MMIDGIGLQWKQVEETDFPPTRDRFDSFILIAVS